MSLDSVQSQRAAASDGGSMTQVMGRHWMIAAGHPLAAQAGARVLAAGGNAIDAGVAAGMTLGVVDPDRVPEPAVMVVDPAATAVAIPLLPETLLIDATVAAVELHATDAVISCCEPSL
jgi:hypothetical protein